MIRRALNFIAISLLSFASSIAYSETNSCNEEWAEDIEKNKEEYTAQVSNCVSAMENGDTTAQVNLGLLHYHGIGVEQDYAEAARLYTLAAEQGDARAQSRLGYMYQNGLGVEKDNAEARRLFTSARKSDVADASIGLGNIYSEGLGVDKDYERALSFYKESVDHGGLRKIVQLAEESMSNKIFSEAANLLDRAAEAGDPYAQYQLARLYRYGSRMRGNSTIPRDETVAAQLYKLAADQGYAPALYAYGRISMNMNSKIDSPVFLSDEESMKSIKEASEKRLSAAQRFLAVEKLNKSSHSEEDRSEALRLLSLAHTSGNGKATYVLAELYDPDGGRFFTRVLSEDLYRAYELYKIAHDRGVKGAHSAAQSKKREIDEIEADKKLRRHLEGLQSTPKARPDLGADYKKYWSSNNAVGSAVLERLNSKVKRLASKKDFPSPAEEACYYSITSGEHSGAEFQESTVNWYESKEDMDNCISGNCDVTYAARLGYHGDSLFADLSISQELAGGVVKRHSVCFRVADGGEYDSLCNNLVPVNPKP